MFDKKNSRNTEQKSKIKVFRSIKGKLMLILFIGTTILLSITGIIISKTVDKRFTDNKKEILYECYKTL